MKFTTLVLSIFLCVFDISICIEVVPAQPMQQHTARHTDEYMCLPCGQDCDNTIYTKPGKCPDCGMPLVKKTILTFKTIQPENVCNYIRKHPNVILLDVRTKEEFNGTDNSGYGTLKNAINIPVQELQARLTEITALKNKDIIVYCSHSHRSPQASFILTQNGFTNITNMAGGMSVLHDNSCKK